MKTIENWIAAAAIVAAFLGAAAMLDGPSDADIAAAQAADLADAKASAAKEAELIKRCRDLRGPRAELVHIRNSQDYACRMKDGSVI